MGLHTGRMSMFQEIDRSMKRQQFRNRLVIFGAWLIIGIAMIGIGASSLRGGIEFYNSPWFRVHDFQ